MLIFRSYISYINSYFNMLFHNLKSKLTYFENIFFYDLILK